MQRAVRSRLQQCIDLLDRSTRSVFDTWRSGKAFAYVITVCDEASAERCPIFPGVTTRLRWNFPDPSAATGTDMEKLVEALRVRDLIKAKIQSWCVEMCEVAGALS